MQQAAKLRSIVIVSEPAIGVLVPSRRFPMFKLKLTAIALALTFAGSASAGWRSMRVEAASLASFEESVATFEDELSTARHYVFMLALQDIWANGLQRATSEQREYTETEYLRRIDGLTYNEIVTLADPSGQITKERYR